MSAFCYSNQFFRNSLVLAVALFHLTVFAEKSIKIIVDPGHGGHDRGANFQHLNEADIVLSISEYLVEAINKLPKATAIRTRTKDHFVPLKERVEFAKSKGGELFLSIHANAVQESAKAKAPDKHATGAEFYFLNPAELDESDFVGLLNHHFDHDVKDQLKESIDEPLTLDIGADIQSAEVKALVSDLVQQLNIKRSSRLAKSIDKHWSGPRRKKSLAVRQAPFYVLKRSSIPAVLVEVGFIDNPEEAKKLSNPNFQKKIAQGIASGLYEFLKQEKNHLSSL